MSNLIIVKPLPMTVGGTFPNVSRVLTPDPKEAAIDVAGGARTIDIDLGSVLDFDTVFVGYTNDSGAGGINFSSGTVSPGTTTVYAPIPVSASDVPGARRHFLRWSPTMLNGRYIRLSAAFPAGYSIGTVIVGKAFVPTWGHEYGSGRPIVDMSNVERLFGGGFGIDEGARAPGWQWTLGDLQPAELRTLWALVLDRGTSRSTLVVEDPDATAGLNERIHWGLLGKLEPYNRVSPLDTSWSLSISDWA